MQASTHLEYHVHDKDFITLTSEGIEAIGHGGNHADHHPNHHHALEERAQDGIGSMSHGVPEEEHAEAGKDCAWQHKNKAKFRFTRAKWSVP